MQVQCLYQYCGWKHALDAITPQCEGAKWTFTCPVCASCSTLDDQLAAELSRQQAISATQQTQIRRRFGAAEQVSGLEPAA